MIDLSALGTNTLRDMQTYMLKNGTLSPDMNEAIMAAIVGKPAEKTPADLRAWCIWRAQQPYSDDEAWRGMDDYYSNAVHDSMRELFLENPGLVGDHIVRDGKLAYSDSGSPHPSSLIVYSGYGIEAGLYEVWIKPSMEGGAHVQIHATRIESCDDNAAHTPHRMRSGRLFHWTEALHLMIEDDFGELRQIYWDSSYCDRCGRA